MQSCYRGIDFRIYLLLDSGKHAFGLAPFMFKRISRMGEQFRRLG